MPYGGDEWINDDNNDDDDDDLGLLITSDTTCGPSFPW
jgi:hypothetical protein